MVSSGYDAIVVGAGHNGLVCAAYLGRAGLRVLVLERSEVIGGAAVSEHPWPGWTVSSASYVCSLLHPQIVADLDLPAHGYEAYLKDPASFTPLDDGRSLLLGRDGASNEREISAFAPADVRGFAAFEAAAERLGAVIFATLADPQPSTAKLDPRAVAAFATPVADFVGGFVGTPVLQATLATDGLIGTFAGPRSAGTTYVLAHHYAGRALGTQGAWGFVRGGMGAISQAAAGAARAHGVEIRTETAVEQILVEHGSACGVVLADGSELRARFVLSNADPKTTFLRLLPGGTLPARFAARVAAWRSEGCSLKLNLALGELPDFLARPGTTVQPHHRATIHVAPSLDYLQHAYEDGAQGRASAAPMLECFMQTPTDPSIAPPGKHLLSVFAQYFPYRLAGGAWTAADRDAAADTIVATLARYAPNVPGAIEARMLLAPPDLEARFGLAGGHIFHGELLPGQTFQNRFATQTPLRGLYLCGSGAHPGGCVSGAPGLRAAQLLLSDMVTTAC